MTKPMTHLQAFCSDDAKRGRVWSNDVIEFRRSGDAIEYRWVYPSAGEWVVTSTDPDRWSSGIRWADEPKTLTPAEAFSALSDGLCLSQSNKLYESSVIKLDAEHGLVCWTREYHDDIGYRGRWFWDATSISGAVGYHVVPDPSQPADESAYAPAPTREELRSEAKRIKRQEEEKLRLEQQPTRPPLKVGDRVKRRWYATKDVGRVIEIDFTKGDEAIQIQWNEGVGAYPNDANLILVEAEPQVEYPLSYADALVALHDKEMIARHDMPHERGRLMDGELQWGSPGKWLPMRTLNFQDAKQASWRIVPAKEGK